MATTWNSTRLVFDESIYPAGHAQPEHDHDFANISVVLSGSIEERVGRRTHDGVAGHVVFKPAGIPHANRCRSNGARLFRIELHGAGCNDPLGSGSFRDYAWAPGGAALALMLRARREHRKSDHETGLTLECLALEVLARFPGRDTPSRNRDASDARGPEPHWFRRLLDLLHTRSDEPFRVSSLANEVGVHPVYLARVFRKRLHGTVGEYVRWLRLARSVEAMRQRDRSLADIALEAGFYDQAHFSRTFRSGLGRSPAAYRREI
ncbi:MAG TPA: AraC family transcriptional regulator [Candidatus Eisenbacteria bacterium]|nr:AraC family transcriptional regulator [Candidatus Eisenbacteria bacterium]